MIIEEFADFIERKDLVRPGMKLVLAVSGGVDSMVLLDLFLGLRKSWNLGMVIAHVNHQLRGDESNGDEEFVRSYALAHELEFFGKRIETIELMHSLRLSKQEAARLARYEYFDEVRKHTLSERVATAHHADDNAETILMNVLRGTGIRGLSGIPLIRNEGNVIRPLLFARRQAILQYAREHNIQFRNDSSNISLAYTRNFLRHKVVPLLETEFGPNLTDSINKVSRTMKDFSAFLDKVIEERSSSIVSFGSNDCTVSIPALQSEPIFLREEIILRIFRQLRIEPSVAKIEQILGLCSKQTGHILQPSGQFTVYKDRDDLVFCPNSATESLFQRVTVGSSYDFGAFRFSLGQPDAPPRSFPGGGLTEYVDVDKLQGPLSLRSWRKGDWFLPLGLGRRKKLSDFFGDQRISPQEKVKIPILESGASIVWVCGQRLDDRFKITAATERAVKLTYSPIISRS